VGQQVSNMSDEVSTRSASALPAYTPYHPRWYRGHVSTWWWLGRWPYLRFILREISSVFVAWGVVLLLLDIRALRHGPAAYDAFQHLLRNPAILLLNVVSVLFIVFHALTWFSLAPRAMVVRARGRRVPDAMIAGSNYALWVVVSLLIGFFLLRG
jgi:fumarate reductase subunit C